MYLYTYTFCKAGINLHVRGEKPPILLTNPLSPLEEMLMVSPIFEINSIQRFESGVQKLGAIPFRMLGLGKTSYRLTPTPIIVDDACFLSPKTSLATIHHGKRSINSSLDQLVNLFESPFPIYNLSQNR